MRSVLTTTEATWPVVRVFDAEQWPILAAKQISEAISFTLQDEKRCSVMLTGGRSAEQLYDAWALLPDFQQMTGVSFFFGDERNVPPDHPASNYGMTMRTLFSRGVPEGCSIFRMDGEDPDRDAAASRYGEVLPESIDVLLLGVGEDGHIASLFPASAALHESTHRVVPVTGSKPPMQRLSIGPRVIARAKMIFVLANGNRKAEVLTRAQLDRGNIEALPARLVLHATWLMDRDVTQDHQ